jgi:hypothetical protein
MLIFQSFQYKTPAKQELLLRLATRPNSFRFLVPKWAFISNNMFYKFMALDWSGKIISVEGTSGIYTAGFIKKYGYPWECAEVSFEQLMENWDKHGVWERNNDLCRLSKFWKYLREGGNEILID